MEMSQKNLCYFSRFDCASHELYLCCFAAVEQPDLAVFEQEIEWHDKTKAWQIGVTEAQASTGDIAVRRRVIRPRTQKH